MVLAVVPAVAIKYTSKITAAIVNKITVANKHTTKAANDKAAINTKASMYGGVVTGGLFAVVLEVLGSQGVRETVRLFVKADACCGRHVGR